jgi:hypothetical protein
MYQVGTPDFPAKVGKKWEVFPDKKTLDKGRQ